ncbi:MAG: cellobiose phosphorylase [Candidatus Omnitrophica bacterium]|nr:cellobiose phosphorylase [Candidatus Omnitrophota bacterium]
MKNKLWEFTDSCGTFRSGVADKMKSLYLPLANDVLLSAITPNLNGDIKAGQNAFLLSPVSRIDLSTSKASRNFWVYIDKHKIWSACGVSKDLSHSKEDKFSLEAGLLWQKITRENKKVGLKSEILSFVPAGNAPVELMQVKITNISSRRIKIIPTSAIPLYARGANSIRDHRHVTSLLQRIAIDKYGVIVKPTLCFDESGHQPNKKIYFVLGCDEKSSWPRYIYPTQEMFCGDAGDLEAPQSVYENLLPDDSLIQGKEAMAGLRFKPAELGRDKSHTYILIMGIIENPQEIKKIIQEFNSVKKIEKAFAKTKAHWLEVSKRINISTGESDFDNWFSWVNIQPVLRKIFGCSFLPDFDYGKGGRGWRDLWQDCLSLILNNPQQVRQILLNNFSGVRIDGSNATIIGKNPGEFISDRNNISRVWMDHGVWPLLTLDLYMNETGDSDILLKEISYFRNHEINRCRSIDYQWAKACGQKLKTASGKIYQGTVLEHLLVENLVQFFNVGTHNHVRLEGADWNDGLDMAKEHGESVAFSCMYAYNLMRLAELVLKLKSGEVEIAEELKLLLEEPDYANIPKKLKILDQYFLRTQKCVSGKKIKLPAQVLANNLRQKAGWMIQHIRNKEWLKEGFFNGYYDNRKKRLEGKSGNLIKMTLTGQVFPVMSGVATKEQARSVIASVNEYLLDKKLSGYHLNTDFKQEQYALGRAFSFVYGEKENGAIFSHMVVMFANALYKAGFKEDGWKALSSIFKMALDTEKSKIYPVLPEYFNNDGRGMYAYLTGSASWFVLTLLTEVFGIKGSGGDLLIEPKLCNDNFKHSSTISIQRNFAGRHLIIEFYLKRKTVHCENNIVSARLNSSCLCLQSKNSMVIKRSFILNLPANKIHKIKIELA